MTALERMRETFEKCTVMAGVKPDFECIYITKGAANALFDEAEAENAKLREQIETLVMYVEADGTRYWVDDDGNQHFDHSAVKDDAAKLRELVRRLYNMADFCRNCPDTERCDVDVEWLGCTVADPIDKLMEELGVEV